MSHNISLAEPLLWKIALSIQEITDCFPVMKELRSHLELADFTGWKSPAITSH
jgi:hypothetical protein